jgi:hypothetical protein
MRNGDAVLSFLGTTGHGSWSTFERAIEDVVGVAFHAYFAARAFSSHALIEFDWLGNREWSVPPPSVVRIGEGRFLLIGVIDEEALANLHAIGVSVELQADRLTDKLQYTRKDLRAPDEWFTQALEDGLTQLHFVSTSLDAGAKLLDALPQIGSIITSRPVIPLETAVGDGETRLLDADSLTFADPATRTYEALGFDMMRVRKAFRPPEYYYVTSQGARRIELELSLAYAAARSSVTFVRHAGDTLAILNSVPLPVLFARALHLNGATSLGLRRSLSDENVYAYYKNVPLKVARVIAVKLLTNVGALDPGDLS